MGVSSLLLLLLITCMNPHILRAWSVLACFHYSVNCLIVLVNCCWFRNNKSDGSEEMEELLDGSI